jgi:hypothetical protein
MALEAVQRGRLVKPLQSLLILAACLAASEAMAAGLLTSREHNRLVAELEPRPMIFFVAKGPADSCGRGCSEWISAVGVFDDGAAQRFRDFIGKLNGRNLPIFFHSPGGSMKAAIEVGYVLRERRMAAGIGRADSRCRVFDKRAVCQKLIKGGGSIDARLNTKHAQCHSACVYAFAGASARLVASNAMLGVHSGRLQTKTPRKADLAVLHQVSRRYYLEMGVDPSLAEIEAKTPHERIYILNRSEIARFGLETRDDSYETLWRSSDVVAGKFVVMKSVTIRSSAEPAEYLTYRFQFTCNSSGKPYLLYHRELALHSGRINKKVAVKFGDEDFTFVSQQNNAGTEVGVSNSIGSFTKLADAKGMTLVEKRVALPELWPGTIDLDSEMKLSTAGLAEGLEELRSRCSAPAPPAPTNPAT